MFANKVDAKVTPEAATYILLDEINGRLQDLERIVSGGTDPGTMPFSTYTVDLTTTHTNLQITNKLPFRYLQVFCDGTLDGIQIRMADQSAEPLSINQMRAIPVGNNPACLYLSNDVRPGRSRLTIYWVRNEKLDLNLGGQDITLSELAVRNGSIHSFDRRGEIIWQEDFEDGIGKLKLTIESVRGSITLSTDTARSGEASLKCIPGDQKGDACSINKHLPYGTGLSSLGFEFSFYPSETQTEIYQWTAGVYTNEVVDGHLYYQMQYHALDSKLYIMEPGGLNLIGVIPLEWGHNYYMHTIKLVIDISQKTYSRILIDGRSIDLKLHKCRAQPNITPVGYIWTAIAVINDQSGFNPIVYLDDFIVTQNEP
jgi:hypothetical protein